MNSEKPLLELRGTRFTIIMMSVLCSLMFCFVFVSPVNWDFVEHPYLLFVLFPLVPIIIVTIMVFMVFRFYPDRIERYCDIWGMRFWEKTVYLKDAKEVYMVLDINCNRGSLFVLPQGSRFGGIICSGIICSFSFVGGAPAREKVIEFFKSVGIEFVNKNYFILEQKKNTN